MSWERAAVLVMAGGTGLRLWPLSRRDRPKPFLSLPHAGGDSMLRRTALRLVDRVPWSRTFVNVTRGVEPLVRHELPELPEANLISAADDRDTLPTVLHAGAHIERCLGGDPLLVLVASDNYVDDSGALALSIERGLVAAARGEIVSVGVRPDRAATEYGYMECGKEIAPDTYRGLAYHEKPDAERARSYLDAGRFDWNSGIFVIPWSALLRACEVLQPKAFEVVTALRALPSVPTAAKRDPIFSKFEVRSLDHGILEHLGKTSVPSTFVRTHVAWDDLGSFDAIARWGERNPDAVTRDNSHEVQAFVETPYSLVVRGLDNLLVAVGNNGDVLVAPRGVSTRLRELLREPAEVTPYGTVRRLAATEIRTRAPSRCVIACVDVHDISICVEGTKVVVTRAPPIHFCDDVPTFDETLARVVADEISAVLSRQPTARIILSAGATPERAYAILAARHRDVDWARVELVQMDEWVGAPENESFEHFLRRRLVEPLGIGKFVPIDPRASDAELAAFEERLGPLDFVLHGIGTNAHVGFNEPGTENGAPARRVRLAPSTARVSSSGVTLGFRSLDRARRVVVAAKGAAKREAIRRSFYDEPSLDVPASRLQSHRGLELVLEREALP
jgi:mannose-1-phosphate guanylyltransferase/6-phosphogluconolactonase/glucosamine-6-phosphate isomerase/deaminase